MPLIVLGSIGWALCGSVIGVGRNVTTMQGRFEQSLIDAQGAVVEVSGGDLVIEPLSLGGTRVLLRFNPGDRPDCFGAAADTVAAPETERSGRRAREP